MEKVIVVIFGEGRGCPSGGGKRTYCPKDGVMWMDSKDGVFSVKSLYRALQPVSLTFFPLKIIWNSCVQPKLSFFTWEASWGRVLTLDRLQKRGWALANRCFCAKRVRSQLTTSSFIVKKQGKCGCCSFLFLEFLGFFLFR